ncbi:hypothetical protein GW846_03550 [Candidatus Gracilibacteria bacterium]|nr:hypothetical protein [Candidatus Gracilibacteria bacterium]
MAQTGTTQDEELLIITDDSSDDSSDMDFSFDFGDENTDSTSEKETETSKAEAQATEDSYTDETILEMEDAPLKEEISQIPQSTDENEESENEEFSLDFSKEIDTLPETNQNVSNEVVAEKSEQNDFGMDLMSDDTSNKTQSEAPVTEKNTETKILSDSHESLNDILSATIAKLQKRQEAIASDTENKAKKEEEIKSQITELQTQVKELEADMKQLDTESKKITSNIEELEGMKLDPVKEHNANRNAKK